MHWSNLRDPQVNARFDDEVGTITRFGALHLGVATQTGNELLGQEAQGKDYVFFLRKK